MTITTTMSEHKSVKVDKLPLCDLCQGDKLQAHYDGKTVYGPWAYMCKPHFERAGIGLGMGRGQELIVRNNAQER